jgi:hypothetical protein
MSYYVKWIVIRKIPLSCTALDMVKTEDITISFGVSQKLQSLRYTGTSDITSFVYSTSSRINVIHMIPPLFLN